MIGKIGMQFKMKTPIGIDWFQKILDFDHFWEILYMFRGGNLLSVTTVHQ